MKNQNISAHREAVIKSMKLAEFRDTLQATDANDMESCVNDLVKNAGLSQSEARVVAAAYRSENLPRIAFEMGLDDKDLGSMGIHGGGVKTTDFAKDKPTEDKEEEEDKDGILPSEESIEDEIEEHGHIPSAEEEAIEGETPEMHSPEVEDAIEEGGHMPVEEEELNNDLSEVNEGEGETALIQIEVPASEIEAVQRLLDEHFGSGIHAENDDALPVKENSFPGEDAELAVEAPADPLNIQDKVEPMDAKQLLARKQERAAILAGTNTRIAEDDTKPKDIGLGKDTSAGGKAFQYAGDAQYKGEDDRPTATKQGSEGNSLKDQNPTFNKQPIPTNNADNLQLKSGYDAVKKDGSGDGSLEYSVDFDKLDNIPSSEPDRIDGYSVPTQMQDVVGPRKTTVAERIVECSGCNNPNTKSINKAECQDCKTVIAICEDCETEGYCPVCANVGVGKTVEADTEITIESAKDCDEETSSKSKQENGDGFTRKPHEDDESRKSAALYQARLKTAYSVSYKLALANVIDGNEVDANAEMWMADNLSPATMVAQGKLMLKSASSAAERVASSYSDNRNVRTANVSLNPGVFVPASSQNTAPNDLKEALVGLFMNRYEN